jgi:pimeloyl-ACP methyl ester carboxylesterase
MGESGFVEVPGGSLYYEAAGSGPAVLLVHAGVANLRMWDPLVPLLSDRYRVVRYDTRGYGMTESEHVDFSNRDDLVAVLDHGGTETAAVVGASRGGIIALDSVIEYPERFDALVVVGGGVSGFEPSTQVGEAGMWEEAERMWEAHEWEGLSDLETRWWVDGPGQSPDRVDPAMRELVHGWILSNYRAEKEEGIPQPLQPPAFERLEEVAVPLLVTMGGLDDPGTNEACRVLASRVAGARTIVYDAAHMMTLEHPGRFADDLLAFLDAIHA